MSVDAHNDPGRPAPAKSGRGPEHVLAPLNQPLVCPVLVGREAQVATLARDLDEARRGAGRTILVAGEAGIGKSRLVAAAKVRAAAVGCRVLQGTCFEPDRTLPYAPLLDLMRAFLGAHDPGKVAELLGPAAGELVKLVPELAARLPGLVPTPPLDPEQEKRRLVLALVQVLEGLAAERSLLAVVEDLHWCDETSLEVLHALARRIGTQPILLVLTYRSDEVHPVLRHFLAGLDRERLAVEMPLGRLTADGVEAMVRAIFDLRRPVRLDFLEAIYGLTEGNPFFVEEVLKSLVAAGEIFYADGGWDRKPLDQLDIPRSVQDAVQRRAATLGPSAREVLTLAAVAGRRFDFALLQAVTGLDEPALLAAIKELIAAQLVVEVAPDRFGFRHALTRRAIYADLLARERRALHRTIAEALERLCAAMPDAQLADLAQHYFAAGVWPKALAYSRQAGEDAQRLYAPRAAVEHFTRALEAAERLAAPPSPELHRARGLAFVTLGEVERARADLETAVELARAAGDRAAEWQGLLDLGHAWAGRDYAQAGTCYRRALALARETGVPASVAHSLNWVGNWHINREQPADALRHHREALAVFEALNDRHGVAETLDLLGVASYMSGELLQATAYYERAIGLLRDLDDRPGLVNSLAIRMLCHGTFEADTMVWAAAGLDEAVVSGESALKLARETGWRTAEAWALTSLAAVLGLRGAYDRALVAAQTGLAIAQEVEHREWTTYGHTVLGQIYRSLLAVPEARAQLSRALAVAQETDSGHWLLASAGLLASTCVAQGDLARAEAALREAGFAPDTPMKTLGQRQAWCARAELALAGVAAGEALNIVDRLLAAAANVTGAKSIPRLAKLRGEALVGLERDAEAEAALRAAQAGAAAQGLRPLLWHCHAVLGAFYRARARRDEAEREFAAARAIVDGLAAGLPDEALRVGFLERATALLPPAPRRARAPGGLTARERDVALLIARGKSNLEIADALFVGKRTVETHVASIFAKLGCVSRAEVAAWVAEQGLADDPR